MLQGRKQKLCLVTEIYFCLFRWDVINVYANYTQLCECVAEERLSNSISNVADFPWNIKRITRLTSASLSIHWERGLKGIVTSPNDSLHGGASVLISYEQETLFFVRVIPYHLVRGYGHFEGT
jgi:hypothetical protein